MKEVYLDGARDVVRVDLNGRTVKRVLKDGRNHVITDEAGNVTRKEYDEWDNLTKVVYPDGTTRTYEYERKFNKRTKGTDERGIVTTYEYDANGNLTRKQEAAGTAKARVTTYTYDGNGHRLTESIAGDGQTQTATSNMTYDTNGNVTSITDPEGNITRFTHDSMGNILTREDGRGKVWRYEYDAKGRLTKATDPNGNMTGTASDGVGNLIRREDPAGKATTYAYSQSNKLTRRTDALGGVTAFAYDGDNNLIGLTDPEGKTLAAEYDLDDRLVRTTDGNGNVIRHVYDEALASGCSTCAVNTSKPSRTIFPTFTREYRYDKRSRKTLEQDLLGAEGSYVTQYAYDNAGNLAAKTDREGRITTYEYDELNRLVRVTDPLNQQTLYVYDNRDNLISLTDARGNTTSFAYDRNNRLTKETRPLGQETAYQYDQGGQLIGKTDAKGQRIEYSYDDAGRMTQIKHFAVSGTLVKTIALTYDNVGNLKTYDDGTTSAVYDYDDVHRKTRETANYGAFSLTTSYAYNKNGTKKSFTYPSGVTIDYAYDGNNQPQGMNIPGAGYLTYNSYRWNRPTAVTLPGGGTKQYDYDPLMRVKTIAGNTPSQSPILNYRYGYDKMDNITQKNTEHGNYAYTYDELYRLIQAANANQSNEAYTYDPVGNRLTSAAVSDWTYNANNELQSYSGVSFQYDANGNTTQKNEGAQIRNFIYDADNRLVEVKDGGSTIATYVYDPFGRRIKKDVGGAVTYYLYSDEGLIGEYDSAGTEIKLYGYRPNSIWTTDPVFMKQGNDYYFYHNDHLSTPQKMTTASGAVVWSATYDAFGKATVDGSSTVTNNLRFPGQYDDLETGLHYNLHRYYDPVAGRYVMEDPIGLFGGINLFTYVQNDPVNWLDPNGLKGVIQIIRTFIKNKMVPSIAENTVEQIINLPLVAAEINPAGLIIATIGWVLTNPTELAYPPYEMQPPEPKTHPPGWTYDPELRIFLPPKTPVISRCP